MSRGRAGSRRRRVRAARRCARRRIVARDAQRPGGRRHTLPFQGAEARTAGNPCRGWRQAEAAPCALDGGDMVDKNRCSRQPPQTNDLESIRQIALFRVTNLLALAFRHRGTRSSTLKGCSLRRLNLLRAYTDDGKTTLIEEIINAQASSSSILRSSQGEKLSIENPEITTRKTVQTSR